MYKPNMTLNKLIRLICRKTKLTNKLTTILAIRF